MAKMTINEFREIKKSMLAIIEEDHRLSEQKNISKDELRKEAERLFKELISLQDKLLSSDLSDIPFEEWEGMVLFADGELDLSKTHANIDFSLLYDFEYDSLNLKGCNVKGIQALDYDEDTFDAKFMDEHPEFFPDKSLPDEVRKKYYDKKIAFSDIIEYPSLRKCVNGESFHWATYDSPSRGLVKAIGFEYAIRLFDENPKFVETITREKERGSYSYDTYRFRSETPFDMSGSYEDAKQFIYRCIINDVKNSYRKNLPPLDVLPQEMIDSFPGIFVKEDLLPKEIVKDFNEGCLTVREIRFYQDIFKANDIDLDFGTRSSSEIININKVFGNIWNYFEQVPEEYDDVIEKYLTDQRSDEELLSEISKKDAKDIIIDSIRSVLFRNYYNLNYFSLDELYAFSQYIPLDEIFGADNKLGVFIATLGFDSIIKYNREHDRILECRAREYSGDTLLHAMAEVSREVGSIDIIPNEADLSYVFSKMIRGIRMGNGYGSKEILYNNWEKLIPIFKSEFLDYDMLDTLLKDMDEKSKSRIKIDLTNGFDGNTRLLFNTLSKFPFLTVLFEGKDLIVANSKLGPLYDKIGGNKFLELGSKYGEALLPIFNFIVSNNKEGEDFYSIITGNDYEEKIDKYIYRMLRRKFDGNRKIDIRILPDSFKKAHPELYLDDNAPMELQERFYGVKTSYFDYHLMNPGDIHEYPEWIPFLIKKDLSICFQPIKIGVYDSNDRKKYGEVLVQQMDLLEILCDKFSNEEILDFFYKYGHVIEEKFIQIDVSLKKEEILEKIIKKIYEKIKNRSIFANDTDMPKEFVEKYPDVFLDANAPEELRNIFYHNQIDPEIIRLHPEWKKYLLDKDLYSRSDSSINGFVGVCQSIGLDNSKIFELFDKYGLYLTVRYCSIDVKSAPHDMDEFELFIQRNILYSIIHLRQSYNEDARAIFGEEHPELFLDEDAPAELKSYFYCFDNRLPLTFELLKQHRDWLPYLEGKNVLLSLQKQNIGTTNLKQLFEKYGDHEALLIGMKNPEAVMQMLSTNHFDILCAWYNKLHFIPHYVVMTEFPIEQSDKFMSSGKKWSQLMRIEGHNASHENISALLKASMCFGVFDRDMDGFNKTIQLFSDIPKKISEQDMQKIISYLNHQKEFIEESIFDDRNARAEECSRQLELIQECYSYNDDGTYSLVIDSQQNKDAVHVIRGIMEAADISIILTPDKAHKLFGGFKMKYDASFRDFILANMDTILSSDEYISFISSMQKQWDEIKALNSNRVLTLDLALAFVKSNSYADVQIGNEKLAEVSNMAGYSQESFIRLQQIYNYGKSRTFSSIPRIQNTSGGYTYEILRLDDPLAVAIGTLTDCCQEIGNAAQSSMEHSMVDRNGRVFVIKDEMGNIVAQSWVWRNKNVICFDNIEIPAKAFTRAERAGSTTEEFANTVFSLYKQAAEELIAKDEEGFKKLLDEGKITEEQYKALKLGKVTVGLGYNDIAESLDRNAKKDKSDVARPLPFISPVNKSSHLYTNDSKTQYVLAGEQDVPKSEYETPTIYSDEFIIHDDSNTSQQDVMTLQKLELATKGDNYSGNTETDATTDIVTDIAYNYGLNPKTTKIIMNANFAIIYDVSSDKVVVGDVLYNTSFDNNGEVIDITDKVALQIRMAIEQICEKGKKFDIGHLSREQLEMCNKALNLNIEIDEERGLSNGSKK